MERSQTDYRIARPLDAGEFAALLGRIAGDAAPEPAAHAAPAHAAPAHAAPAYSTPAPAPTDELPAAAAAPADVTEAAPGEMPAMAALPPQAGQQPPVIEQAPAQVSAVAIPEPEPEPIPEPVELTPDRPLTHWLQRGGLERRVRLQRQGQSALLIDPRSRVYHGPATLKPLAPYFEGTLLLEDFGTPDAATWEAEASAFGPAQPLARLLWLGNLLAGQGSLLPGLDPAGTYRLSKWPQTEREYPKHFRIATAMMKGPATLDEIGAASGVSREEVADFVNANLATGYAELVLPEPPAPEEPPSKPGGLFGRMRGR